MSGKGDKGRAEDFARYKQYDYRAVSGWEIERMQLIIYMRQLQGTPVSLAGIMTY